MNPLFKAWINQPATELRGLQKHGGNRFLAAAAGQVLAALDAKALGDAELVRVHLLRASSYWLKSQETEESQVKRAVSKIEQLRADGIAKNTDGGTVQGGPHMSIGDSFRVNGQARGEKAVRNG